MPQLEEVYQRMLDKKKEKRDIAKGLQDALKHDTRYQKLIEETKKLREEKKSIENRTYAESAADAQKIDLLDLEIKSDAEMLTDLALNKYVAGETVEVTDRYNVKYVPEFSVTFKKVPEGAQQPVPERRPELMAEPA